MKAEKEKNYCYTILGQFCCGRNSSDLNNIDVADLMSKWLKEKKLDK
jgi:hypothetical protein